MIRSALALAMSAGVLMTAGCGAESGWGMRSAQAGTHAVRLASAGDTIPGGAPDVARSVIRKSPKRGIAYDLISPEDFEALSAGVSWWYNWSPHPGAGDPEDYSARYQMDFLPMIWGMEYEVSAVEEYLQAHPGIKYLLVMNEPNLISQADLTPQQAASLWPDFEAIAAATGVKIVGPAVTWGTMPGYRDPVEWLDAFYTAYEAANEGRKPLVDYIAFHWYDYGLDQQLDRLAKYGKPFWVTEVANWHSRPDGAQVNSPERQQAQMADMVKVCESRADVFRYAWFTGRRPEDAHATSLLAESGKLTELGKLYVSLPYADGRRRGM